MNKEEPLISVIVPVYNVEEYLRICVDSIINQTYENLEIILIDDGSKDNSGKICDEYMKKDNRIIVIHQENKGVSVARNTGIQKASGKWVSFVDSDDWLEKNFVECLYENAIKYNSDVVFSGYNKVYKNSISKINFDGNITKYSKYEFLEKVLNVQTGFGFVHMKLVNSKFLKGIFFDEELVVAEDALFSIQLCENDLNFLHVPNSLYNYRVNKNSVVRRFDENYDKKYLKSMIKIKEYLTKNYSNDKNILQNFDNFVGYHIMLILVNYCFHPQNNGNSLKLLKNICNIDLFKDAIKNSNYKELSITRKITLFTIKYKLYWFTAIICKVRQLQIK